MKNIFFFLMVFIFSLYSVALGHNFNGETYSSVVVNARDMRIIHQESAHKSLHPASLTKMMTLYLLFDALEKRQITMYTKMKISSYAASQPRLNLNLKAGEKIAVKDAIPALIIHSANDVAVVVAEHLGQNESNFARMMNQKALKIGMKNTKFFNPSGLHHPQQVSTAYDMALLTVSLKKHHKKYYPLFKQTSFKYKGQLINTHNRLVKNHNWIYGMKTGFISSSGFNITTTSHRPEGELVAVMFGGDTAQNRDTHVLSLLNQSYSQLRANKRGRTLVAHKKNTKSINKANHTHTSQNSQNYKYHIWHQYSGS